MKRHSDCWHDMATVTFQRDRSGRPIPDLGEARCRNLKDGRWSFTWGAFTWTGAACCQHKARAEGLRAFGEQEQQS